MKKILLLLCFLVFFIAQGFSQNCALNCISKLNVSLPPNECTSTYSPYSFITNPSDIAPSCKAYLLKFEYPYGTTTYSPANRLDLSHAGYSMTYRVIDSVSNNSCWGTVKVNTCNVCAIKTPPLVTSFTTSAGPYIPGSTITLYASATDNKSISKVEFYNLGTLIGTDYSASYSKDYRFDSLYASVNTFKAIAYDNCGDTASSSIITITTTFPTCFDGYRNGNETGKDCGGTCANPCPVTCEKPFYLNATVYGSDVTLSWMGSASQYQLQIENTVTNQIVVSIPVTSSPYHISLVDGSYKFSVRAKCGYEYSLWSDKYAFVVSQYHPTCYGPSNLSYSIYGNKATLSWTGTASQYHLEIKNVSTNEIIVSDLHASSPYVINLEDGYYTFRVKSICGSLYSDWCDWVPFTIHTYHPYPNTCNIPTSLTASVHDKNVNLAWSGNAPQYEVEIQEGHSYNVIVSAYVDETYFNSNLPYGDYRWRVRSKCNPSYSDWSSWKTFTVEYTHDPYPPVGHCDPPHHLSSSVNDGLVNLGWEATAEGYELELDHIETQETKSYKLLGTSSMSMHMPNGSYKYKVRCTCGSNNSDWSDWTSFLVTSGAPTGGGDDPVTIPCDIPGLLASMINDHEVTLSWAGIASKYFIELEALDNTKSVSLDVNESSYHTTLSDGVFRFRVKSSCNAASESDWSDWTYLNVGTASDLVHGINTDTICNNTSEIRVNNSGDSSLTLSWNPGYSNTRYTLIIESEYSSIACRYKMDGYKDTILRVGGLIPNTQYKISLYTDCGNGLGTLASTRIAQTLKDKLVAQTGLAKFNCQLPIGTNIKIESSTQAVYSWLPVQGVLNYTAEIISDINTPAYNQSKIIESSTTTYSSTDLIPGGSYLFRIKANCNFSKSNYSSNLKFTMPLGAHPLVALEQRSIPGSISIEIFPNPAHDIVHLRFNGPVKDMERIQIINIQGQLMQEYNPGTSTLIPLNLNQFNPGMYILKVITNKAELVKKLVIE